MSYTPPAGSAVNFQFDGVSYSAAAGNLLNFDFALEPRLTLTGGVVLGGIIELHNANDLVLSGAVSLVGNANLNRGVTGQFSGAISARGSASILGAAILSATGAVRLGGSLEIERGEALSISNRINLGGAVNLRAGRVFNAGGRLPSLGGEVALRHGISLSGCHHIGLSGNADFAYTDSYALVLSGPVFVGGLASIDRQREAPLPSLSILTRQPAVVIFTHGV